MQIRATPRPQQPTTPNRRTSNINHLGPNGKIQTKAGYKSKQSSVNQMNCIAQYQHGVLWMLLWCDIYSSWVKQPKNLSKLGRLADMAGCFDLGHISGAWTRGGSHSAAIHKFCSNALGSLLKQICGLRPLFIRANSAFADGTGVHLRIAQ